MRRKAFLVLSTIFIVLSFCTAGLCVVDGTWTTTEGSPTLAGYIQTYTGHSIVVILTAEGDVFHVFIGGYSQSGVDLAGYDNPSKHLVLTFSSDSSATGTLTLADQTQRSLTLARTAASPDPGHEGDGIYQYVASNGAFLPAQDSVSCYLQFYDTNSMIAIFTKDLIKYYVFLVGDYTQGVQQVSDYIHGVDYLTMTFNQDGTIGATIDYGMNGSESWTLTKYFTAPDTGGVPSGDCDVGPQQAMNLSNTLNTLFAVTGETPASALLDALSTLAQGILGGSSTCPTVTIDPPLNLLDIPSSMTVTLDFGTMGCTVGDLTVSGSAVIQINNLDVDIDIFQGDAHISGDFSLTLSNLDIGAAEGAVNGTAAGNFDVTVAGDVSGTQVQLSGQANVISSNITQNGTTLVSGGGSLVFDLDATSPSNIPFTATFTSNGLMVMGNAISGMLSATGTAATSNNVLQELDADLTFTNFGTTDLSLNGTASVDAELTGTFSNINVTTNVTVMVPGKSYLAQTVLLMTVDMNDILTVSTSSQSTNTYGNTMLTITGLTVDLAQNCDYPTGGTIVFTCPDMSDTTVTYQGCDTPPVIQ